MGQNRLSNLPNVDRRYRSALKDHLKSHRYPAFRSASTFTLYGYSGDVLLHSFGNPGGLGFGNIIRSVNVVRDLVFVTNQKANTISVYSSTGGPVTTLSGMMPLFDHSHQTSYHTFSDAAYEEIVESAMISPYSICKGEEDNIYYITDPLTSRVLKIEIPHLIAKERRFFLRPISVFPV